VRRHLLWASASLALIASGCGGSAPAPSSAGQTCVNAKAAHRAYLVVQHLSGTTVQRCVGFDGVQINADDLMKQSGVKYETQTFSGLGKAVCAIDNEPAQFSECFPKDKPFWALFVETGGGPWTSPQTGYGSIDLKDGDGIGWRYETAAASPAPPPTPAPKR
jgi:hypothetical protein